METLETLVPGFIGMALGFGGAILLGREVVEGLGAHAWLEAPGRITSSGVERVRDESGLEPTGVARLAYEYTVRGTRYTGHRLAFGAWVDGNMAVAEAISARYPSGARVTVYHHPTKPERAVLERRISLRLRLFAAGCAALGLTVAVAVVRSSVG